MAWAGVLLGGRLTKDADFVRLWAGETVSAVGDRVSALALPTAAILLLGADAFAVGLLYVCFYLPYPVLALPAGVMVDRLPRRTLMVAADLGRFLAVASIPVAWAAGHLSLAQLYAVALVQGSLSTVFEVAYRSYLPGLVGPEGVVEGNARLEASEAAAATIGPGLGGLLVQALTAPYAMAVDAVSFLASAAGVATIRRPELTGAADSAAPAPRGFVTELREGVAALVRHPIVRWTAACVGTSNCGLMLARTVFLLFAYQVLLLQPAAVGAMLVVFGLAGLGGAAAAPALAHRLGTGAVLALSIFLESLGWALLPLAIWLPALPVVAVAMFLPGFFGPVWNVTNVSLRQALVPPGLQGRIHASHLAIAFGTIPLGALLAGLLAGVLEPALGRAHGLGLTLAIGGLLGMASVAWILLTPVRRLRLN